MEWCKIRASSLPSSVWTGPLMGLLASLQIEQLEECISLIIPITVTCCYKVHRQ